ncbi:MAG: Trehalose-phosphate synthase [Chlamydiae bacterium]|nr:Trehalose-phosphate synthase [Chlamydiota bacterium]
MGKIADQFRGRSIAIIANKPPMTPVKRDDLSVLERSVGGLTAALEPLIRELDGKWFCTTPQSKREENSLLDDLPYKVFRLELLASEISCYYEGYSNKQLWPLFHYFPSMCVFDEQDWAVYRSVNEKMADLILQNVKDGDFIWVHDYHFLLLPCILRKKNPNLKIGFFLHIPFPNQELFRLLANREELLLGLLGADLIGFHTTSYANHFKDCIRKLFPKIQQNPDSNTLTFHGRKAHIKEFPISVDFEQFNQTAATEKVQKKCNELRIAYGSELIGLSVDRVDYSKGHVERLLAIEQFFDTYPEYIKKITFIQISVPTRTNIKTYQELKKELDETTGRIEGKFSSNGWSPVHYIYRTLPFEELVAYYLLSDIALVVPLRDGMNLVAKEYIASRIHNNGVLILSEFAGAAEELTNALLVNPYQKDLVAKAIKKALDMHLEEKTSRMRSLREQVKTHDVHQWVDNYFTSFLDAIDT